MKILIEHAQYGDKHALRELLLMHRTLIRSVVRRFVWNTAEMEDVMQNVFMKVMKSIGAFSGTCRFSTWIYRIAVNESVDANRRHSERRKKFEHAACGQDLFPDYNAPDGLSFTIETENNRVVHDAIARLPEGMRCACELYYIRQQTGEEAAATLDISVQAFFMRLSAAREKLKKELRTMGVLYDECR